MKDAISNASATVILYRLAIARFFLFFIVTLCSSIMTALAGTLWEQVDNQTRFLIVVSILSTVASNVMAFFDQSIKTAREGKDPITGLSNPPFPSTQAQVDAGVNKTTFVSPATLANMPAVKAADEHLPKSP